MVQQYEDPVLQLEVEDPGKVESCDLSLRHPFDGNYSVFGGGVLDVVINSPRLVPERADWTHILNVEPIAEERDRPWPLRFSGDLEPCSFI